MCQEGGGREVGRDGGREGELTFMKGKKSCLYDHLSRLNSAVRFDT